MRPLYDARISDLGPGDLVKVECACGHSELLTAGMLATAGVGPERKVTRPRRPDAVPRARYERARDGLG
jgi:hypothetical protein